MKDVAFLATASSASVRANLLPRAGKIPFANPRLPTHRPRISTVQEVQDALKGMSPEDRNRVKAFLLHLTRVKLKTENPVFDDKGYQANLSHLNGTRLPNLGRVKVAPLKARLPNRQMKADAAAGKFAAVNERQRQNLER